MGAAAGTTMGYGSAPKRDTGGESVQEFMASHLIGSTDSPPPRSASVAECRTWSHGSQRMGLDANVSRKRLFGTRHDFGSGRADNTLQHGDHMFQTTTSQHFAPRRLHDTLAQGDTRLQRKLNEWDTQATLKKKESIGKIQHTQQMHPSETGPQQYQRSQA